MRTDAEPLHVVWTTTCRETLASVIMIDLEQEQE